MDSKKATRNIQEKRNRERRATKDWKVEGTYLSEEGLNIDKERQKRPRWIENKLAEP
jgi:hypothetical protein